MPWPHLRLLNVSVGGPLHVGIFQLASAFLLAPLDDVVSSRCVAMYLVPGPAVATASQPHLKPPLVGTDDEMIFGVVSLFCRCLLVCLVYW